MNHASLDDLWLLHHGALDEAEARTIRAHLETGCPQCTSALADAERAADTLAFDAAAREPGAGVREALLDRVAGPGPLPIPVERHRRVPAALAAGLVGLGIALGAGATWFGAVSPQADRIAAAEAAAAGAARELELARALAAEAARQEAADLSLDQEREKLLAQLAIERGEVVDARARAEQLDAQKRALGRSLAQLEARLTDREAETARLTAERASLEVALNAADEALNLLESPGVEWVVLSGEDDASQGAARFFWEWDRGDCMIDGGDLPRIAPGQTYALWVAYESGAPVLVASFAPDANGSARLLAPLPKGEGEVRSVHITLEEAPDPVTPEGTTLLAGVLF